jgi:D-aminopeptidase
MPAKSESGRMRARDLGITIGRLQPGEHNAITDIKGIRVGHTTLISGEGKLKVGHGPVRTGVTVIIPHEGNIGTDPLFAGWHSLNGNGEMTGTSWIEESGLLTSPIAITNTHSVGAVHEAMVAESVRAAGGNFAFTWSLPVVAETCDIVLNDMNGFHVRAEHVAAAFESAASGTVAEGSVGGGTGMICHDFKGGIGTASRVLPREDSGWTVGVLVQANYGVRELLRIDGVPVGREIPYDEIPDPERTGLGRSDESGSIIIIAATDAPLLPHQCKRLARRAGMGLARVGSVAGNESGDLFLAFSTGNRDIKRPDNRPPVPVLSFANAAISTLFEAVVEATEEAIVNALCMATTVVGVDGRTAHAIPLDRLVYIMRKYNRLQSG